MASCPFPLPPQPCPTGNARPQGHHAASQPVPWPLASTAGATFHPRVGGSLTPSLDPPTAFLRGPCDLHRAEPCSQFAGRPSTQAWESPQPRSCLGQQAPALPGTDLPSELLRPHPITVRRLCPLLCPLECPALRPPRLHPTSTRQAGRCRVPPAHGGVAAHTLVPSGQNRARAPRQVEQAGTQTAPAPGWPALAQDHQP